jgi:hypothetical protein
MNRTTIWTLVLSLALVTRAEAVVTDAQKCESAIELASGKYAQCRLNAESKYTKNGDFDAVTSAFNNCTANLQDKYDKALDSYGGACPTTEPAGEFAVHLNECVAGVEVAVAGGSLPACGDGVINVAGEQCDGADLLGETCMSLGFAGGTLGCTGCGFDTSGCKSGGALPATGQTTGYTADKKKDGIGGAVPVPDDGTLERGGAPSYVYNFDGTITDLNTGLMWELKGDAFDFGQGPCFGFSCLLHHQWLVLRWSGDGTPDVGIAGEQTIWDWLDDVNAEGGTGFAGYNDWRIPNRRELESILNIESFNPAVSAWFNFRCEDGCTPGDCSCTFPSFYWSSSTYSRFPGHAWIVDFEYGDVSHLSKDLAAHVRAVRGGS